MEKTKTVKRRRRRRRRSLFLVPKIFSIRFLNAISLSLMEKVQPKAPAGSRALRVALYFAFGIHLGVVGGKTDDNCLGKSCACPVTVLVYV